MNKLLVFLSVCLLCGCSQPDEKDDSVMQDDLSLATFADSLFQLHVDSSHIAGAAVIVQKDGEILLDRKYGFASLELKTPMPDNANFEIGSVTKQFTAAAILKLAEEGKLSLDDDVSDYLDYDAGGRKITIRQLLNHTSGIPSYTEIPEFWQWSVHTYERDTMITLIEKNEFLFEPGEALIYNNSAYFMLGLIIEELSQKSYEEFLREKFFEPLGMNNTYYCTTREIIPGKVYGYSMSEDGLIQKSFLDHTWPYAAGSLCSTTEDLLTWMNALHGGQVFGNENYASMITPDSLNNGSPIRYAMGLAHFNDYGNELIQHGGGINGFLSETKYYPEEDLYIVCLVNTTGPQGAGFFAGQLTWKLLSKNNPEGLELSDDLASFSGTYSGQIRGQGMKVKLTIDDNGLIILPEGQQEGDTVTAYIGNNTFMDGNDIITFHDDHVTVDQVYGYYVMQKE